MSSACDKWGSFQNASHWYPTIPQQPWGVWSSLSYHRMVQRPANTIISRTALASMPLLIAMSHCSSLLETTNRAAVDWVIESEATRLMFSDLRLVV